MVRDSAGIKIIENPPLASDAVCTIAPEPRVDIGVASGLPEYQLHRVFDAATLSDGRFTVVNGGSGEIRIYDRDGRHRSSFGREGGGPGEFRNLFQIWVMRGDTLLIGDYRPWRFSFFTPEGTFVRSVEPRPPYINPPTTMGVLEDGSYILGVECCDDASAGGFEERHVHLVRHARTGETMDTIGIYSNGRWGPLGPPELNFVGFPLFEPVARVAVGADRIVAGRGRIRELEVMSADGSLTRLIRWAGEDRRVPDEEVDLYRSATLANARTESSRRFAEALASEDRPANNRFPAHSRILLGRTGQIWVKEFPRPSRAGNDPWRVFEPDGSRLCTAVMPDRFEPYEIGRDYLLGEVRDTLGVEHVRVYDFTTPARAAGG